MHNKIEKAIAYYRQGRHQDAIVEAKNVLSQQPHDVDANLLLAAIHAAQSDYAQVVIYCESILKVDPLNERASYNAAVASQTLGQYESAIKYSRLMPAESPSYNASRLILVSSLYDLGDRAKALFESKALLENNKGAGEIYLLLSRYFRTKNELGVSREICQKLNVDCVLDSNAYMELALLELDCGNFDKAIVNLDKILSCESLHVGAILTRVKVMRMIKNEHDVLNYLLALIEEHGSIVDDLRVELGISYFIIGDNKTAMRILSDCLSNSSRQAEIHHYIGNIYERDGFYDKALISYKNSLATQSLSVSTLYNMGVIYEKQGNYLHGIECLQRCIGLSNLPLYKHVFVRQLSYVNPEIIGDQYENIVIGLLEDDSVDTKELSGQIIRYLRKEIPFIDSLIKHAVDDRYKEFCACMDQNGMNTVCESSLLKTLLANTLINNYDFEIFVAMLRRYLHSTYIETRSANNINLGLCSSIAIQCVLNGFIYMAQPDELDNIDTLRSELELDEFHYTEPDLKLAVLSMYVLLGKIVNYQVDIDADVDPFYNKMLKYQVNDLALERDIRQHLTGRESIRDEASVLVMNMYEDSPYPVWKKLNRPAQTTIDCVIREISPHSTFKTNYTSEPNMLIAGCGTGRHAILNAMQIKSREVIAIDLSASSLAYAKRMADEYKIHNIRFEQMDILNVVELGEKFDVIESVGVLHHMRDPVAGLACLVDSLKSGGLINLGFYSTIGRRHIKSIKSHYHRDGEIVTDNAIRAARHEIMRSSDREVSDNVSDFYDFYSLFECRDLLFHISEHDYTLIEISAMIDQVGLKFIGFGFTDHTIPEAYKKTFPDDTAMSSLKNWHEFEKSKPDTFASMYVFWCYKPI